MVPDDRREVRAEPDPPALPAGHRAAGRAGAGRDHPRPENSRHRAGCRGTAAPAGRGGGNGGALRRAAGDPRPAGRGGPAVLGDRERARCSRGDRHVPAGARARGPARGSGEIESREIPTMRDDTNHPPSEDLFAYRDGELLPEKRALIEAHVMGCSICRSFIDQVSSLEAELRQSPDRAPSEYLERLHESVRARIAASAAEAGAQGELLEDVRPVREVPGRARERAGEVPARARAWRERERRRGAGDDGRIKELPRL